MSDAQITLKQSNRTSWRFLVIEYGIVTIITLAMVWIIVYDFITYRFELRLWDFMFISGSATTIAGMIVAKSIPKAVENACRRLYDRRVFIADETQARRCLDLMRAAATRWAKWTSIVIVILLVLTYLVAFPSALEQFNFLVVIMVFGGFLAGRYLGRMVAYGRMTYYLKQANIEIKVQPGHLDGAAGLKPIGALYFYQALVMAIPGFFLAIWWLIIPIYSGRSYSHWREPYFGLLMVALTFEVLAFLVPLLTFHRLMKNQKTKLLEESDKLSQEIATVKATLARDVSAEEQTRFKEQLAYMTDRYWQIENMPTWPVDREIRRRFTVNNVALSAPLLWQIIGAVLDVADLKKIFV